VFAQGKTELLVYTALEADQIKAYQEAFQKDHPEIELKFVRDSTGIVTAKLLAEKAQPRADVVWGLAATSLLLFKTEGLLEAYKPAGAEERAVRWRGAVAAVRGVLQRSFFDRTVTQS